MNRIPVLAVLSVLALFPSAAFAHSFLNNAEPRVGSVVSNAPTEIRLTFTEAVEPSLSTVELKGPQGDVSLGEPTTATQDRATLVATVGGKMAPGTYHVFWHVVSVDTHKTQGDFTFEYWP